MKAYKAEKIQCESRLNELKLKEYSWINEEKVADYLRICRESLLSVDPKSQRKIIETFVDKIIIYPDRIDLSLKVDMKFETESDKAGGGEPYTFEATATKKDLFKIANKLFTQAHFKNKSIE